MSQLDELMDNLSQDEIAAYTATPETEPHIIIGKDRYITVPDELRRIAVQYDHDIETVTFDCPRYWDDHDLSTMKIYVNYLRSDGVPGCYLAKNVIVDGTDDSIVHFDWTLSRNATMAKGTLSFLVCAKKTGEDGNEANHWNSELNREMTISEGLECEESVLNDYPDIITDLLTRMDTTEQAVRNAESTISIGVAKTEETVREFESYFDTNLFDKNAATTGMMINGAGTVMTNTATLVTDFIPVISGEILTTQATSTNTNERELVDMMHVCAYDADKNVVSSAGAFDVEKYTVPRGVSFIRITMDYYEGEDAIEGIEPPYKDFAVVLGETIVPYIEYPLHRMKREYFELVIGDIETALDSIIEIQNSLIGGEGE